MHARVCPGSPSHAVFAFATLSSVFLNLLNTQCRPVPAEPTQGLALLPHLLDLRLHHRSRTSAVAYQQRSSVPIHPIFNRSTSKKLSMALASGLLGFFFVSLIFQYFFPLKERCGLLFTGLV
jgi:hypothetical protein